MGSEARPSTADAEPQPWEVVFTPEAERWFMRLDPKHKAGVERALDQLKLGGPDLGAPSVKRIKSSRYHHMKELRSFSGHRRALFAFDPNRRAVVLVGGDKTNDWRGWYKRHIPPADKLYDRHLEGLGKEATWPGRAETRAGTRSGARGR